MKTLTTNTRWSLSWLNSRTRTSILYVIVLVFGLLQLGCAHAKLESVIIGNQLAPKEDLVLIEIIREGEPVMPELKMELQKGDEIRTPVGVTACIQFHEGSEIIMTPETYIRIENPEIFVWFGKIILNIKDKFRVKTKYAKARVTSTRFIMHISEDGESIVTMIEGSIILASNDDRWSVPLQSGQRARMWTGESPKIKMILPEEYNQIIEEINRLQRIRGGKAKVLVPRIMGIQESVAREILISAGLKIGKREGTIEGNYPIGTVVDQQPAPGTSIKPRGSVNLRVRVRAVEVPGVTGRPLAEVRQILQQHGLRAHDDVKSKITGLYDVGMVNDQSPKPGTPVPEGTPVRLWVEEESVVVPDVTGTSITEAEARIRERGLRVNLRTVRLNPQIRTSQVERQEPSGGTRVKPRTTIILYVAAPGVRVPNLIGQLEERAPGLLQQAGLRVGFVSRQWNPQYPARVVMSQSPQAGQVVERNSTVALTVSKGPKPRVPVEPRVPLTPIPASPVDPNRPRVH